MRSYIEPFLYLFVRGFISYLFVIYFIKEQPDFMSGFFTFSLLVLLCVGIDNACKHFFFSRSAYEYLSNVDYLWEVNEEGIAIDEENNRVVVGGDDFIASFNAYSITGINTDYKDNDCYLVIHINDDHQPFVEVNFFDRPDLRKKALRKIASMMPLKHQKPAKSLPLSRLSPMDSEPEPPLLEPEPSILTAA